MEPRTSRLVQHIRRWPRRVLIVVAALIVVLVAARLALPYVVKSQVNARLQNIPGYAGHVDDIGIHLWRGAYSLHGIAIYKVDEKVREPFFLGERIDFSLAWRELVHRRVVADFVVDHPQLIFVKGSTKEESTTDTDRRWQQVLEDVFPVNIQYFEIRQGVIRYMDKTRQPPVDVFVKNMHVLATGLRNRPAEAGDEFPARIFIEGDTLGAGKLQATLAAEPLAEQPHFHLSAKVANLNLPALNESLKAFANVDVGRGKFEMAAEMAGKDGGFQGYVKPFFEDLDFHNLSDKNKSIGSRLWERMVAGLAWLVKNKSRDQVGTRIPFEGRFGDPQIGLWRTVTNAFRHGFIRAFNPTVEGSVHADNVKPNGQSVDGSSVAAPKDDRSDAGLRTPANQAPGAPTGRVTDPNAKTPGKK
jgi:hypothetical protein